LERIDLELWTARDVAKLLTLVEDEKRYYQEIIATLPQGVAIVASDLSLLSVNRAFRRYFNLGHEQVTRLSLNDLIADGSVRDQITGTRGAEPAPIPFVVKDADGTSRKLQLTAIPFPDWFHDGANDLLIVIEEAAAGQPAANPFLGELAALVWKLDPATGHIDFGNSPALPLPGWNPGEVPGALEQWSQRVHPEDAGRVARVYQHVLDSGSPATVDYRARNAGGRVVWLSDEVRLSAGPPACLWVLTHDVTLRREDAARLADSRKMEAIARLAGKLSHDFNNILMVIQGNVEEAIQDLAGDDARRESLSEVLKAADRMASITQQLLGLSRPPAPKLQVVDLNQSLRQMALPARLDASAVFEPVSVDARQLESALRELLASVSASGGGEAYLAVSRTALGSDFGFDQPCGPFVRLRIGPLQNVGPEFEERWNEPFHGAGKGVALAFRLLQGMRIGLRLVRTGENTAEYEAWLPLAPMPEMPPEPPTAPEAARPAGEPHRETVMVVDDEDSIRSLVARVLRREGYRVLEASSSEEALSVASGFDGEIALIVSDVMLPQMRGTELVAALRASRPSLRALLMSGYTDDPALSAGNLPKGDAFLQKPFSLAALLQTVRMVLSAP
jgi:CheY-like chemotaxis protein/PAS domain-containing protein